MRIELEEIAGPDQYLSERPCVVAVGTGGGVARGRRLEGQAP